MTVKADRMTSVWKLYELAQLGYGSKHWYADCKDWCNNLALLFQLDVDDVVDVLALTSPRVSVKRNQWLATRYLTQGKTDGMLPSIKRSLEIWDQTGQMGGKKVSAFAAAIRSYGLSDDVVLDVWMARALGIPQQRLFRLENHAKAVKRIEKVAEMCEVSAAQAQAMIWAGTVLTYGRNLSARNF